MIGPNPPRSGRQSRARQRAADRHHAFVGVGWDGQPPHDGPPFIVWNSNVIDENAEWHPDPRDHFSTYHRRLAGDEMFALVPAGVELPDDVSSRLNAPIAFLTDDGDDPAAVSLALIEAIREQAAENDAVGSGVMVNCIPRSPGPPGGDIMFVGDAPKLDVRTPEGRLQTGILAEFGREHLTAAEADQAAVG